MQSLKRVRSTRQVCAEFLMGMKYKALEVVLHCISALANALAYIVAYVYIGVLWVGTAIFCITVYIITLPFIILRVLWRGVKTGKYCHGLNISITTKEKENAKDG